MAEKKLIEKINKSISEETALIQRGLKGNLTLQDKIKISKRCGSEKFQPVVFKVEDIKYKILKTVCPNFLQYYDKYCDRKRDKKLKKYKSQAKRIEIKREYRLKKMLVRKSYYREQNLNYHMDPNKPMEFRKYLEWNKGIHKKGLVTNAIITPILGIGILLGIPGALPLFLLELGSAFINFQCVNIQNYNMYRLEEKEELLKKLEEKRLKRNMKNYGEAAKAISETMAKTDDIPTIDDIVANLTTKEQLNQMRNWVLATINERNSIIENKQKNNVKRRK